MCPQWQQLPDPAVCSAPTRDSWLSLCKVQNSGYYTEKRDQEGAPWRVTSSEPPAAAALQSRVTTAEMVVTGVPQSYNLSHQAIHHSLCTHSTNQPLSSQACSDCNEPAAHVCKARVARSSLHAPHAATSACAAAHQARTATSGRRRLTRYKLSSSCCYNRIRSSPARLHHSTVLNTHPYTYMARAHRRASSSCMYWTPGPHRCNGLNGLTARSCLLVDPRCRAGSQP